MRTVHTTKNLTINFDEVDKVFVLTVRFDEDAISGRADGECPRCKGPTRPVLWELEGPGSNGNTIWLVCDTKPACMLDGEPLRWSRDVSFERDWDDV